MSLRSRLGQLGRRGSTTMEFVLVLPILLGLIFASIQVGMAFFANAGLQNAVAEGAREATLWPRRTDAQVRARITSSRFGLNPDYLSTPVVTYGTEDDQDYVEIQASCTVSLDFGIFSMPGVVINESRRAWLS